MLRLSFARASRRFARAQVGCQGTRASEAAQTIRAKEIQAFSAAVSRSRALHKQVRGARWKDKREEVRADADEGGDGDGRAGQSRRAERVRNDARETAAAEEVACCLASRAEVIAVDRHICIGSETRKDADFKKG